MFGGSDPVGGSSQPEASKPAGGDPFDMFGSQPGGGAQASGDPFDMMGGGAN